MSEILRSNFEEKFPEIIADLKSAAFIGIDSEFSGLLLDPSLKYSLFDTGNERYKKLRENVEEFLCVQFGLTMFSFNRDKNSYYTKSYCFYLFPRTFGSVDTIFKCQASSFEFLCHHHFDFMKFVYEGISFLNNDQYKEVEKELREGHLFRLVGRSLSHSDEEAVQALCSQVAVWLAGGKAGENATDSSLLLNVPKSSQSSQCISYVVHHELRLRFPTVWTIPENKNIRVLRVSSGERSAHEKNQSYEIEMQTSVLLSLRGFSRVFEMLVQLKKPIVGHNLLLDLMIMYKQFFKPLPKSYSAFKTNMNNLFPRIYDTKYMSSELKWKLARADCWESNTMDRLFHYFKWGKGAYLAPCTPMIVSSDYEDGTDSRFHNAGWDSFCTGFCFVRMAHYFASIENGRLSLARPLTSTEHIALTGHLCNRVNIIRGSLSHIVLDGQDPHSTRPDVLIVKAVNGKKLDIILLTERLSKYGSVDVKQISCGQALIAASTRGVALDISKELSKSPDFTVSRYSMFHQLSLGTFPPWTLALAAFGVCYILYRSFTGKAEYHLLWLQRIRPPKSI